MHGPLLLVWTLQLISAAPSPTVLHTSRSNNATLSYNAENARSVNETKKSFNAQVSLNNQTVSSDKLSISSNSGAAITDNRTVNHNTAEVNSTSNNVPVSPNNESTRSDNRTDIFQNGIVNPHAFTFHLNSPHLCSGGSDILLWIHSAPKNFRLRSLIRSTWGNPKMYKHHKVSLVFLFGMSTNKTIQRMIEYESEIYNDVVQETFIDSYKNLTYKAIMGCKWTSQFCSSADLVIKSDDDAVIDVFLLLRHIQSLRAEGRMVNNSILCSHWNHNPVQRSGKWMLTKEQYADDYYPPYCSGLGFAMTGDIVPKMYNQSFHIPFFWVDDVYLSGMLTKALNVTFDNHSSIYGFIPKEEFKEQTQTKRHEYHYTFYHVGYQDILPALWKKIYQREIDRQRFLGLSPVA